MPVDKYFRITETSFKEDFRNHTEDLRFKKCVSNSKPSKYKGKSKDEKITPNINWNTMSVVDGKCQR